MIAKSTTPTSIMANPMKVSGEPNGLVSVFNSYVLFPSDSFDLSNEQMSGEDALIKDGDGCCEVTQQQQQNSSFYPIEDVLANLIR